MPAGLSVAIALLVQATGAAPAYGPPAPPPAAKPQAKSAEPSCASATPKAETRDIVICAQKPQGYRLNPDVVQAKRELRSGRPKRPERYTQSDCGTIGPMGCRFGGIDLLGAAVTALTMIDKAAKGENVGKMFVTDPHPTEYQLYLEAKAEREAKDAQAVKRRGDAARRAADPSR